MDKKIAEELVTTIRMFEEPLNILTELTMKIEDAEEAKDLRRYIGEIMALLTIDLLHSIVTEYPELDPYKDYFKDAN